MKLDYKLKSVEDRKRNVEEALAEFKDEPPTPQQLKYMADYLLFVADSKKTNPEARRATNGMITKNRAVTINKREVSFEETVANLQNGEDGIYAMIVNDKNRLMDNRAPITQEDANNIPGVRENLEVIENLKKQLDKASGKKKYSIKSQIISKYQELYTLKASYLGFTNRSRIRSQLTSMALAEIPEYITMDENGIPHSTGFISLMRPEHVSFLLKYYSALKQDSYYELNSDMHWLLIDLENAATKALLPKYEVLYDLLVMEVDGLTGAEIIREMEARYGIVHSEQYFSTLWCKKIPKLIAEQVQKDYVMWYYTKVHPEEAKWKICRTCGKAKLAHPFWFHKNTSKDGYYSKCRECRSRKNKGEE